METVNINLRNIVKMMGGVDAFLQAFRKTQLGKASIYGYTKLKSPQKPPLRLVEEIANYFEIPLDDLYKKDIKKSGWTYTPKGLPKLTGKYVDGPHGFTYRVFQAIEMLQKRHYIGSLQAFVNTLGAFKDSYRTIVNMRRARQRATAEFMEDIKRAYPEVNANFLLVGEEPVFLEKKRKYNVPEDIEVVIEKMVAEKVAEYGKKKGMN